MVKNFITYFHANILDGNVSEMHSMYDTTFNRITEKLYQKQPWPQPEAIAPLVDHDPVFTILYKELYYRHIYAKLTPTFEDRSNSFQNYCELFNYILSLSLAFPPQRLYHSTCHGSRFGWTGAVGIAQPMVVGFD